MAAAGSGHADFSKSGFGTKVLHCGQEPDATTGAVAVPISMSTTFAQVSPGIASGADSHLSYHKGYEYSRTNNPTRAAFEQACAAAEGAKHGLAYASGMSATTAIIHLLKTGDHVVSIDDVYGGTQRFFRRTVVPTYGINFSFVDTTDFEALEAAFQENTKLVWLETPTNPTLKVSDIKAIAEIAHKHNALLVVDNTFMSPYFQQPLSLGADITMSSVTKYINGHSDVVMGFVGVNDDELNDKLRFIQNGLGAIPSPFDSYQALRGLKTLHVRMQRHGENALKLASFLEKHDMVEKVLYPGLPSHPQHEVAKKNAVQGSGGSGMITFYVKGKLDAARVFLENVKVFTLAESLGAVESLVEHPAIMTHASVPAEDREKLGISDTLIRLSVGIENYEDLEGDLDAALQAAAKTL